MKLLTFSSMAIARLKANKRQYLSLVLGVLMSIFMISTLVFSVFGIYQPWIRQFWQFGTNRKALEDKEASLPLSMD